MGKIIRFVLFLNPPHQISPLLMTMVHFQQGLNEVLRRVITHGISAAVRSSGSPSHLAVGHLGGYYMGRVITANCMSAVTAD